MSTTNGLNRFSDALKQLDQALTDWEQIIPAADSPSTTVSQRKSHSPLPSDALEHARQLIERLKVQMDEF
jgi:hypothetical protein